MVRLKSIWTWSIASFVLVVLNVLVQGKMMAQTWTSMSGPQVATNVKAISVDNGGTPTVYAAENSFLLKSTNGGTAWRATSQTVSTPLAVVCKPDNSANAVAGGSGFLKNTTDGGTNWTSITGGIIDNLSSVRLTGSQLTSSNMFLGRNYYSSTSKAFWYSANSGASWTQADNFTANTTVKDIATYPVHDEGETARDDDLWACGSGTSKGLWKSTNGGVTWDAPVLTSNDIYSVAIMQACNRKQFTNRKLLKICHRKLNSMQIIRIPSIQAQS